MLKGATPCGRSLKQPLVFGPGVMVCGMMYLQKCCALSLLKQINSRKQMTANINMYFGKENKSKKTSVTEGANHKDGVLVLAT